MNTEWFKSGVLALVKPNRIYYAVFLTMLAVIAARFWGFIPGLLIGDDLSSYWIYKDATLHTVLADGMLSKYRPFPTFLFWTELNIFNFGPHTEKYWAVGVLMHSVNATLAFAIFRRLSNGRLILSGALAFLVAISHFALYQVTQISGLVEGPSLTFLLIIFLTLLTPANLNSTAQLVILIGSAFLLIHTHERYIGVMPWVCMVILFSPRFQEIEFRRRIYIAIGLITIPIYYICYKLLSLNSSFLVGAGGKPIKLEYMNIFQFTQEALLSLVGINNGPPFLVGINLLDTRNGYLPLALLIASACMLIIALGINRQGNGTAQADNRWGQFWHDKIILIEIWALGMLILGPALLTIRFEQRWLMAPYILLLAAVAWSMGHLMLDSRKKRLAAILFILFAASTLLLQLAISPYLKRNVFFVNAQSPAEVIKRDLVGFITPSANRIGFFGNKKTCVWIFERGIFVKLYFPELKPEIVCRGNIAEFDFEGESAVTKIVGFNRTGTQLHDLTEWGKTQKELADDLKGMRYDFISDFDKGEIAHAKYPRAPKKSGVFVRSHKGQEASFIVRNDFEVKFRSVSVEPNDVLRFWLSAATPLQGRIRATVRIYDERSAKEDTLYSKDFAVPAADGDGPEAQRVSIPLKNFKGRAVSLIFSVATVDGTASNKHWVSFKRPRIVSSTAR